VKYSREAGGEVAREEWFLQHIAGARLARTVRHRAAHVAAHQEDRNPGPDSAQSFDQR
jgi:hypothetical protein